MTRPVVLDVITENEVIDAQVITTVIDVTVVDVGISGGGDGSGVTQGELNAAIAAIVDAAPEGSDTLNELAIQIATKATTSDLGTAAVADVGDFDPAGAADAAEAAAVAASQPVDTDLTAIAQLTTTVFGRAFLELVDADEARSALELGTAALEDTDAFDPAGAAAAAQDASQPVDANLSAIAALSTTPFGRSFLSQVDPEAVRSLLGLGSAATADTTDFDAAGSAASAQAAATAASQPVDSDLTAIAALTTTSYGRAVLALADAAALRSAAGLVIGADVEAHDADLTTIAGLSPSNDDVLQRKAGAWANRTIAQLATDLGLAASYQPLDSDLTAIAALTTTSYGRALLTAANASALRSTAGLVIGTDVEAHDTDLTTIAGLSPSNDDVLQRKSGAWTTRTVAQLATDLGLASTYQPLDSDLTAIAALTTTSFGRSLLALADAAAGRTALGVDTAISTAISAIPAVAGGHLVTLDAVTTPGTTIVNADIGIPYTIATRLGAAASNTISETSLLASTYTIPANSMDLTTIFDFLVYGSITNNTGSDRTVTFKLKFGTAIVFNITTPALPTSATARSWVIRANTFMTTFVGTRTTCIGTLSVSNPGTTTTDTSHQTITGLSASAIDLTTTNAVDCTATMSTNSSNLSTTGVKMMIRQVQGFS